jgi:hypothetical protein
MNLDDAVQTIAKKGFSERQARFLVLVARHSGVCVMRQTDAVLLALVRLLARQAAREVFARTVTESDSSFDEGRE